MRTSVTMWCVSELIQDFHKQSEIDHDYLGQIRGPINGEFLIGLINKNDAHRRFMGVILLTCNKQGIVEKLILTKSQYKTFLLDKLKELHITNIHIVHGGPGDISAYLFSEADVKSQF